MISSVEPLADEISLLVSPAAPEPGRAVRVLAAGEDPSAAGLSFRVSGPDGARVDASPPRNGGGPPFWTAAGFEAAREGRYVVEVRAGRRVLQTIAVEAKARADGREPARDFRAAEGGWTPGEERLYSAWVDALFRDADERSSWPALHDVTRDADRNLLFDHLGLGEDGPGGVAMTPDCADNPYFLRAYFAWKRGLPFGYRACDRGSLGRAPSCGPAEIEGGVPGRARSVREFQRFLAVLKNAIHSGSARTRLETDDSDYYPLPLVREALRPGAVYADPYGHTLMLIRWVPPGRKTPGVLLAVDAQPDGTIGVKRFWKGNFLFSTEEVIGDPGWKAFRPLVAGGDGRPRPLPDAALSAGSGYPPFSLRQKRLAPRAFYDAMARLINPRPLDPVSALRDLFDALREQLIVRVDSVDNGTEYMAAHPGTVVPMPAPGPAVFQTGGPWEDFSTPNRDLRLLIAIDTVLEFPDEVVRSPGSYRIPRGRSPEDVRAELRALGAKWAAETSIAYVRTDRSLRPLTLAQVFERREAFEVGYNPNDGPEIRWGAPADGAEMSTCRRRAPRGQAAAMEEMRRWFRKRLHPPT